MILLAVIIHEFGHFIFGKLTGYSLIYFVVLGITFERADGRITVSFKRDMGMGQCLMFHESENRNPVPLICGGLCFNLFFGSMFWAAGFITGCIVIKVLLLTEGSLNISLFIYNAFLGSKNSDGNTLIEVKRDSLNSIRYNRIMQIARYLHEGKDYSEMPDTIFETHQLKGESLDSSLKDEYEFHLAEYRKKRNGHIR